MKALTIREPYATLVAKGIKKYEFRSWNTHYRGDLYIHAAKGIYSEIKNYSYQFRPGEIVAIATLSNVIKLNHKSGTKIHQENPKIYDVHSDGFAWVLENIRPINESPVINGQLGLWNYELPKN